MESNLKALLEDLVGSWPRASRRISDLEYGCKALLTQNWKVLMEEATRLHKQPQDISGCAKEVRDFAVHMQESLKWIRHHSGFLEYSRHCLGDYDNGKRMRMMSIQMIIKVCIGHH